MVPLQAGEPSRKRERRAVDPTPFLYAWAIQYEIDGNYDEAFTTLLEVIRNGKPCTLEKSNFIITKSKEDLKRESAVMSLARHLKHQLEQNNPNACSSSIYHKDGIQSLREVEDLFKSAFADHGCLLSAVNLGNIARAEGKQEAALEYYRCLITHMPSLSPVDQFATFAIGYPLVTEYRIKTKASSTKKLLQLTLLKNDYYAQKFKELYSTTYDKALEIVMDENSHL
jgi:tetratricopeptide (TPR) repeat protein